MPQTMFPEETAQSYSDLYSTTPMQPPQPGVLAGAWKAPFTGVALGAGGLGELVGTGLAKTTEIALRAEQAAAPWSPALQQMDPDEFQRNVDQNAAAYAKSVALDPQTNGAAAQVIQQFGKVATELLVAPEARLGAVAVGAAEFRPAKREFVAQGIDEDTATQLAAAQAVLTGAGALLPGGVGAKAAVRVGSGAAINLSVGAASRYNTHQVLDEAGYTTQAAQYRVLDGLSMATDVLLGSFFGWMHSPEKPFATPTIPQDVIDAGLAHLQSRQAEIDLAPGIPATPEAREAHITALGNAESALIRDEATPVPEAELPEGTGTTPPTMLDNPAQDAAREAAAVEQGKAVSDAADGLLSASKKANEPPKTTQAWVAGIIERERAAAKEAKPAREVKAPEAPMDPETKVAVDSIDRAIQDNPALHDFQIEDPETGEKMSAFDALQQVKEQAMTDADTGILHEIAAACGVS